MRRIAVGCAVVATVMRIGATSACELHLTPTVPSDTSLSSAFALPTAPLNVSPASGDASIAPAAAVAHPAIASWKQNTTGLTGSSPSATINNYVSTLPADVQWVAYNASNAYVRASGVPSHPVGPFGDGNPAVPSNRNRTFRIPLNPQPQAGAKTNTGLGAIGVMVNGVPFYNASDARSYQNQNVWHQNANVAEAAGFDSGPGHPSPIMGTSNPVQGAYHYHQSPAALIQQLDPGNTGQHHSPIIGFALDGFPVYGPYGFAGADGTGGVERIESSYRLRSITARTHLANGSDVADGPAVGGQYPLGYYLEDFEFVTGSGDLDLHNGRFAVTPEYPEGTYAYFATLDATGSAFYPYLVGPSYYGVVATDNLGAGNVSVPADATLYVVPEPSAALAGACAFTLLLRRRRNR